MLLKDAPDFSAKENLSAENIYEDLALLKYALGSGYGGKDRLKPELDKAFRDLDSLSGEPAAVNSSKMLCDALAGALFPVPDRHLAVYHLMTKCGTRLLLTKSPGVGNNIAKKKNAVWEINRVAVKGREVPVISVTGMPPKDSPAWEGFLEAVKKELAAAPAAILDLRENGGGDNAMGAKLAAIFYGQSFPGAGITPVPAGTPEACALLYNDTKSDILLRTMQGEPVPEYLAKRLKDDLLNYNNAKSGELPPERKLSESKAVKLDKKKLYGRPLLILQDGNCASSCESIIEMFKAHPRARTVGENTAGMVHFCPTGTLVLPNSRIFVLMGTQYNKYKDGRFIEKKGYAPDVRVEPGADALDAAVKVLEKDLAY